MMKITNNCRQRKSIVLAWKFYKRNIKEYDSVKIFSLGASLEVTGVRACAYFTRNAETDDKTNKSSVLLSGRKRLRLPVKLIVKADRLHACRGAAAVAAQAHIYRVYRPLSRATHTRFVLLQPLFKSMLNNRMTS